MVNNKLGRTWQEEVMSKLGRTWQEEVMSKLGRTWQEEVMSKFKILSLNLSEGNEETATKSLGEFSRYLG